MASTHRETLKHVVMHDRLYKSAHLLYPPGYPVDACVTEISLHYNLYRLRGMETLGTSDPPDIVWKQLIQLQYEPDSNPDYKVVHIRRYGKNDKYAKRYEGIDPAKGQTALQQKQGLPMQSSLVDEIHALHLELPFAAQQIFGPDRPPKLKILAYGDFSYGKHFEDSSMLLCRADQPKDKESKEPRLNFRKLHLEVFELQELLLRSMPTLEAFAMDSVSWVLGG